MSRLKLTPLPKLARKKIYYIVQFYNISQTKVAGIHHTSIQRVHNALTQEGYEKFLEKITKTILRIANTKHGANFLIEQFYEIKKGN